MGSARWKKKKPSGRKVTDWDIQQAEKRMNAWVEKSKWKAESEATAFVFTMMYKALMDTMGFTLEDLVKLQGSLDELAMAMQNDEITIHDIRAELIERGVGFLQ